MEANVCRIHLRGFQRSSLLTFPKFLSFSFEIVYISKKLLVTYIFPLIFVYSNVQSSLSIWLKFFLMVFFPVWTNDLLLPVNYKSYDLRDMETEVILLK